MQTQQVHGQTGMTVATNAPFVAPKATNMSAGGQPNHEYENQTASRSTPHGNEYAWSRMVTSRRTHGPKTKAEKTTATSTATEIGTNAVEAASIAAAEIAITVATAHTRVFCPKDNTFSVDSSYDHIIYMLLYVRPKRWTTFTLAIF
jgi:hypothetical protein